MAPVVATPKGRPEKNPETFRNNEAGDTRDKIGAFAGVSGRTVEKIAARERQTATLKRGSEAPSRKVSGTGKTRDKIGAFAGVSGRTVEKIAAMRRRGFSARTGGPLKEKAPTRGRGPCAGWCGQGVDQPGVRLGNFPN